MSLSSAIAEKPALLIVDDDPLIADTLGYYLGADFQVFTVGSRGQAIAWLQSRGAPPPLALVDLGLPPTPQIGRASCRVRV